MSNDQKAAGHCLCRAVKFEYVGKPNWTVYCHCESCRRAASSAVVMWISVPCSAFQFTQGNPRYFQSSSHVRRAFCGNCGSPLTYENDRIADEVHLYAASLADPSDVAVTRHVFVDEQMDWLEIHDDFPRCATTSQGGGEPIRYGPKHG